MTREEITAAYLECRKSIYYTAYKHCQKYGGDTEDTLSYCNEAFLLILPKFDGEKAKLTTWVSYKLRKLLLTRLRDQMREYKYASFRCSSFDHLPDHPSFDVQGFLFELSDDAKTIVNLLIEFPLDLSLLFARYRCTKPALKSLLRKTGWEWHRIEDGFREISNSLS